MLSRSVPFYDEMNKLTVAFALKYITPNSTVYDLGCSTASTLIQITQKSKIDFKPIGVDNSNAMLIQAINKAKAYGLEINFLEANIFDIDFAPSSVIISNYTLQFIRPLLREKLVKKIYDALDDGAVFIFSEKIISEDKRLDKLMIDEYYEFKKTKGYSEFEISQKREALENVLIPYTYEENKKMCQDIGFKHFESIFRWNNFTTFIAIK